jgi:hypothetical protein
LFESKVWHFLCMYVCVWMRETETESSEREGDQKLQGKRSRASSIRINQD